MNGPPAWDFEVNEWKTKNFLGVVLHCLPVMPFDSTKFIFKGSYCIHVGDKIYNKISDIL